MIKTLFTEPGSSHLQNRQPPSELNPELSELQESTQPMCKILDIFLQFSVEDYFEEQIDTKPASILSQDCSTRRYPLLNRTDHIRAIDQIRSLLDFLKSAPQSKLFVMFKINNILKTYL